MNHTAGNRYKITGHPDEYLLARFIENGRYMVLLVSLENGNIFNVKPVEVRDWQDITETEFTEISVNRPFVKLAKTKDDKEFCDKLKELAKRYGWAGDLTEVVDFVIWVHNELRMPIKRSEIDPPDEPA